MTDANTYDADDLSAKARKHLWMHFTRMSSYADSPVPTIVRGEGARIFDANGKSYLDGLAGLFVVQAGHGRVELGRSGRQASLGTGVLPALVLRAIRRRSNWPTGWPRTHPAT